MQTYANEGPYTPKLIAPPCSHMHDAEIDEDSELVHGETPSCDAMGYSLHVKPFDTFFSVFLP